MCIHFKDRERGSRIILEWIIVKYEDMNSEMVQDSLQ
jgi:hypothetical protein